MKSNSLGEFENHNLVMFPSSKNFKIDLKEANLGIDPLHDLLHEYSHLKEEDIPSHLDHRFEMELLDAQEDLEGDAFDSLEAFMNRHQRQDVLSPDDKLIKLINDRMDAIKEAKDRIKFYLDEIEMFLPTKRK